MLYKHSSTVNGNSKQEDANFYVCATETLWMPSLEDYFAIYFLEEDKYTALVFFLRVHDQVPFKSNGTNNQTVHQLYQESKNQDAQRTNNSL